MDAQGPPASTLAVQGPSTSSGLPTPAATGEPLALPPPPLASAPSQPSRLSLFAVDYFHRIPAEMLLGIANELPTLDLPAAASVCKRFHFLATPILIKRLGLNISDEWVTAHDTSSVLALAIWCRYLGFKPPYAIVAYISTAADRALLECQALVDFFQCVRRLQPNTINTTSVLLRGPCTVDLSKKVFRAIIKSGVQQLRIKQLYSGSIRAVGRSSPRHAVARGRLLFPRLKTFQPDASFLFDPQYFTWTLDVINGSLIKHLVLKAKPEISSWSHLLSCMTIPSLCHLTIDGSVSVFTLSDFLDRHPALECLDIGRYTDPELYLPITGSPGTMRVPTRHRTMHRMVRLRAPLSYVSHLIGTSRWGTSASLLTLEIYADVACPHFPFESRLALVLREISDMEWLSHVTIAFPPSVALSGEEWSRLPRRAEAVPDDVGPLQYPALRTFEISQNVLDVAEACAFGYPFTVSRSAHLVTSQCSLCCAVRTTECTAAVPACT